MITFITKYLIFFPLIFIFYTKSPVKMMINLILIKILIFTYIYLNSGQSWFSFIFLLICVGGIMVMMMIMASISPNNKSGVLISWPPIILMIILIYPKFFKSLLLTQQVKMILEFCPIFSSMMFLMSFYFLTFIMIISSNKSPMRMLI